MAMVAPSMEVGVRNRILSTLPHADFIRVSQHLEPVTLKKGETIYLTGDEIKYAHFLDSGLLSLSHTTGSGSPIWTGMVGNEGMLGVQLILRRQTIPFDVTVQFKTAAFRISAEALQEEFNRGGAFQKAVLSYVDFLLDDANQSAICHRFHSLVQNLSRWLLSVHDRTKCDVLNLTHEHIANALGAPRTAVTVAAGSLQRSGCIRYSRGKITILNRDRLKIRSCECYRRIHHELGSFLTE